MRYFFDNNLSPKFPRMLAALGEEAIALRDWLPQNTTDVELIERLSLERDLIFVTADRKIRTRHVEATALKQHKITSLFIAPFWNKKNFWEQAAWLVARWQNIDGFARSIAKGTCAEVKQNGKCDPIQL